MIPDIYFKYDDKWSSLFSVFRFAYPYHLLHREQMLLFTYTVDQFIDYFNHPAPLSCLGGDF